MVEMGLENLLALFVFSTGVTGMTVPKTHGGQPAGFFPADLTSVKWSHGTNSIAALDEALCDAEILMLESDILMGFLIGGNASDKIPVMAHGPDIYSDLTFERYLKTVMEFNNVGKAEGHGMKGIKIDFKDEDVMEPVLLILVANGASQFPFPVWFNADVLRGPIDAESEPIDATKFLSLTTSYLPEATLSTGWKTRFGEGDPVEGSYLIEHMNEMVALLRSHNVSASTPVTYPIRTGLGVQSISQILYLLDQSEQFWSDSTITLWHGGEDPVLDLDQVLLLVDAVGRDRCFADIGIDL